MEWISVTSSNLSRVRYDETSQTLEVEFQNGNVYQYFDVPQQVFESLVGAESCGKYLNTNIKGYYRYARA
ncbi:MAG: KTSC domain-containing protein [Deltaproteobacteria bacterium]|nr:KTSC domain-containing protein [Deltaproteobacteria bacterium]